MNSIQIYTDGSCRGNPGPGGWAAKIWYPDNATHVLSGAEPMTTNNRMELLAVIKALEYMEINNYKCQLHCVELFSDSEYVVQCAKEYLPAWLKRNFKGVKNVDLWTTLAKLLSNRDIRLHWVRGHAYDPRNQEVDAIAREQSAKHARNTFV